MVILVSKFSEIILIHFSLSINQGREGKERNGDLRLGRWYQGDLLQRPQRTPTFRPLPQLILIPSNLLLCCNPSLIDVFLSGV